MLLFIFWETPNRELFVVRNTLRNIKIICQFEHAHLSLKGQLCLHCQKYVSKTFLLFTDNTALIQIYWKVFTTCIYVTICELKIYYFN